MNLVAVLLVLDNGDPDLLEVALAGGATGILADFLEDRE